MTIKIVLLLITCSCGLIKDRPKHDYRFNPILQQFEKDAAQFKVTVSAQDTIVTFGDVHEVPKYLGIIPLQGKTDSDAEGVCGVIADTNNDILKPIAKIAAGDYFKKRVIVIANHLRNAKLDYLESLVYHELGHCILNQGHAGNGIMGEYGVYNLMNGDRYYLLEQLFKGHSDQKVNANQLSLIPDNLDLFYKVEYQAFNQKLTYYLFKENEESTSAFISFLSVPD